MLTGLIIVLLSSVICDNNINRRIYTNYRGNAQHDSYLTFGDSTFTYPLKLIWNNTEIQCQFVPEYANPIFANNTYYCIDNYYQQYQAAPPHILSINPINGQTLWSTNSDQKLANWMGLAYTINGYLGVYDSVNHKIYILNGKNGNISHTIQLPSKAVAAITSYNNLFYAFYETYQASNRFQAYGLLSIDPQKGIVNSINMTIRTDFSGWVQTPTFCLNGEIIILYDLFTIFTAYNSTTFDIIWSNKIPVQEALVAPPVCIEPNKIIYNSDGMNSWEVIDVANGDVLHTFEWENEILGPPAIHVDKQILIFDSSDDVMAMNITDSNPNNWENIWKVHGNGFSDIIIVDDSVILTNDGQEMVILDINNGSQLYQYKFQPVNNDQGLRVTPGIDINGDAILIVSYEQHTNFKSFILFAFQSQ